MPGSAKGLYLGGGEDFDSEEDLTVAPKFGSGACFRGDTGGSGARRFDAPIMDCRDCRLLDIAAEHKHTRSRGDDRSVTENDSVEPSPRLVHVQEPISARFGLAKR